MLAGGLKSGEVAAQLGMSRMGLWKWRRLPAFSAELRRLHERLALAAVGGGRHR